MSEQGVARLSTGVNCTIAETASVAEHGPAGPTVIGDDATIRAGTVVYRTVEAGDGFATGHDAVVREGSVLGDDVLVGTKSVLDGTVAVGDHVSIQSGAYVPESTTLGDSVFLGPYATITNDAYPIKDASEIDGVTIETDVSIGANATIMPGVTIGEGSFVAGGAVVTDDVPPATLAVGVPATHESLPEELEGGNRIA